MSQHLQLPCSSDVTLAVIYTQAPIKFVLSHPTGQPGYVVTVRNKNWFTTTEGLGFSFRLLADGVPIKQGQEHGWTQFDIAQIPPQVSCDCQASLRQLS